MQEALQARMRAFGIVAGLLARKWIGVDAMTQYSTWRQHKRSLMCTSGRDFERALLPTLRLIWPDTLNATSLGHIDRMGVDFLADAPKAESLGMVAIQAKSFESEAPGVDAIRQQIRKAKLSIEQFSDSDLCCDRYIIVYNRDRPVQPFHQEIETTLCALSENGRVKSAELWNMDRLMRELEVALTAQLQKGFEHFAATQKIAHQEIFGHHSPYVHAVPARQARLQFLRDQPCRKTLEHTTSSLDVRSLVAPPETTRWTLLTGVAGAGKTTAILNLASHFPKKTFIYVPCASLSIDAMSGTTALLGEIVGQTVAGDVPEGIDIPLFRSLAVAMFKRLLLKDENPYVLILDALDENRRLCRHDRFQVLVNTLSELRCSIILTTRIEELLPMLGRYELAFGEISNRFGSSRFASLIELDRWEASQISEFLRRLEAGCDDASDRAAIGILLETVRTNQHERFYGKLLSHPLFLSFAVEDVMEHGVRKANRAVLMDSWISRKIRRDLSKSGRSTWALSQETADFIQRMKSLMELVAFAMTEPAPSGLELVESIDAAKVEELARVVFGERVHVKDIGLFGVLAPSIQSERSLSFHFVLRTFQEYFLAAHFVRHDERGVKLPAKVQAFHDEISMASPLGVDDSETFEW